MTQNLDFPIQFIYLHGFNSGFNPEADKTKELEKFGKVVGFTTNYLVPSEVEALEAKIKQSVASFNGETILVGTSLGGYFARYFAMRNFLRTILINPSVEPYETLLGMVGERTNYFTKQTYLVTHHAVVNLSQYNSTPTVDTLMILATDDEVIDFEIAMERYGASCKVVLTSGGHRLESLNNVTPEIQGFINRLPISDYPLQ